MPTLDPSDPSEAPNPILVPLLVVRAAHDALAFYVRALGARVVVRYEHGAERRVSHADARIGNASFAVTEEARAWNSDAPPSLGGSPVVLQLFVDDASATMASMVDAGATVVFPLAQFLGERMARLRDPFGHLWLLRERVERLSHDEIQRRRDELYSRFASGSEENNSIPANEPPRQGAVHLVLGPVGAVKSTFALALSRETRAVRLTLDEWMARLFRADRPDHGVMPWYAERAERCIEQILATSSALVASGTNVILEIGLLDLRARARFFERARAAGFQLTIHAMDAPRDVRRDRVEARNRERGATFSVVVPLDIFELASDLWEPLAPDECEGRDVRFVTDQ